MTKVADTVPSGKVPGVRYWFLVGIVAGSTVGLLTSWWVGVVAAIGTVLASPFLYAIYRSGFLGRLKRRQLTRDDIVGVVGSAVIVAVLVWVFSSDGRCSKITDEIKYLLCVNDAISREVRP